LYPFQILEKVFIFQGRMFKRLLKLHLELKMAEFSQTGAQGRAGPVHHQKVRE
jgi:hypothetical protein